MNHQNVTGTMLLFIVVLPVGIWYIYLNVGNPPGVTWKDNLSDLMSMENELMPWFYASVASGVISCITAFIYFSKLSKSKTVLLLLLAICMAQALPAIWFLSWDLKILYSFPVVLGYLAYKNPNKLLNQIGAKEAPPG